MQPAARSVRAVNRLTARWAADIGTDIGAGVDAGSGAGSTVLSATSVWPLLALLADAAHGPARAELEEAVGLPAADAAGAARQFLDALSSVRGTASALGLWAGATLPLHPDWVAGLPAGTLGVLSGDPAADRGGLDAWAAERTRGLIPSMPVQLRPDTLLVLAAAQTVRTRWLRPFAECEAVPDSGPWAGRWLLGLRRETSLLDRVGVTATPEGPLTVLKVVGDTGVDVHLLLGYAGMTAARVVESGVAALSGTYPTVTGAHLPPGAAGPGLQVSTERSLTPEPTLAVLTSPFGLTADHDLLRRPETFGLLAATDTAHGHFPGIGPEPLAVDSANQSAVAVFDAKGFESASVTAVSGVAGGLPPRPRYTTRLVEAVFDRPFGFLAVHRTSRLVLTAGWVADPTPHPESVDSTEVFH
jgi:hypothetical protein